MNRPVHFEFDVEDAERAKKFYEKTFGWKINKWEGPMNYWLIETGPKDVPGIDGAFMLRNERDAFKNQMMNTLFSESLDEDLKRITANGGKIVVPKQAIPGAGYLAYFQDTEGNVMGIMQSDMDVK